MKQKLLMLLAVLLTGGMLVACGPGDESVEGTEGGGAGVVDEPFGDTDGEEGDVVVGDEVDAEADAGVETDEGIVGEDAEADEGVVDAEGETVQMDLGDETEATEERAADGTESELETTEDTATAGEGEEGAEGDVAGGGAAAPAAGEAVVITLSQAAEGVAVENIEGAEDAQSLASTEESNPELNLSVGQRYEFVYDGDGDLVFFDADNQPLLTTAGTEGAFAEDGDVSAEVQDGRISFTLTEELAQELDHYAAGPDEQGGSINAN